MRDRFTDEELRERAKKTRPQQGHGPLSRSDMLALDLADHLKWIEYAIYASQGGKPRKPEPTPRPGVPDRRKKQQADTVAPLNAAGIAHLQQLRSERG